MLIAKEHLFSMLPRILLIHTFFGLQTSVAFIRLGDPSFYGDFAHLLSPMFCGGLELQSH